MSTPTYDATEMGREMIDRWEVTDLVSGLGRLLDERRLDALGEVAATDIQAIFPFGSADDLEGLRALAARNLGVFEKSQHVITDVLVELDGDRAGVRANVIAVHVPSVGQPATHFTVGGTYRFEARRAAEGWRLTRMELDRVWTSGEHPHAAHGA